METEMDLRKYVRLLLRRWWFIAGLAVLAAAAALVTSSLLPRQYEAEAMVALVMPQNVPDFDYHFDDSSWIVLPFRAFPSLADSDGVLVTLKGVVEERWPAYREDVTTLHQLRNMVKAKSGVDASLVILTVRAKTAQEAADLTNAWAEIFVAQAQDLYGRSQQDLTYFEAQLAEATTVLDRTQQDLVEFQERNQVNTLTVQRDALLEAQRNYLREKRAVEDMGRDVQGLRAQLNRYPSSDQGALGDELTALFLEIKAFNASAAAPIQLQITNPEALSGRTVGELQTFLGDLWASLQGRQSAIVTSLAEIEPETLDLQQQVQGFQNELDRLTLAKDVARETYLALSRKVVEMRLAVQDPSAEVRLISRATVPEEAVSSHRLRNAALAGTFGLVLGVAGVLAWQWWRGDWPHAEEAKAEGAEPQRETEADGITRRRFSS